MKFTLPTAALVLSLLGSGEAARIELNVTTGPGLIPVYSSAYYGDDGKMYSLGAFNDGCRKTKYDWIRQICLDSDRERGHVVYSGGTKKCFRMTKQSSKLCGGSESCWGGVCNRCWHYVYTEAKCTW
ncbi:hypothetical protein FNYG_02623 [Fusarium nygamai]|uniref:Uncharacterized protein n=1 Tax=Gibberella nygamai TaxID=42673 RepID=A0A2K0WNT4_GIBNY|nr:hypothetical protein FNYG_02623 [Fusarium nygamai]